MRPFHAQVQPAIERVLAGTDDLQEGGVQGTKHPMDIPPTGAGRIVQGLKKRTEWLDTVLIASCHGQMGATSRRASTPGLRNVFLISSGVVS